jgi:uncharacterized protein YecT (DUF1311 family)
MTKLGFALLLLFMSSLSYGAQNTPRTKDYGRYMNKTGAVDPIVLECISEEYARQGKRLNAAYRNLMGSLKGDRRKQQLEVQRPWARYTEANCGFFHDPDDDTSARILATECKVTARIQRAAEL